MENSDTKVVEKAMKGDKKAFEQLFKAYYPKVRYSLAKDLKYNYFDAEDVAQVVFLYAFKNLYTLRKPAYFLPWLFRVSKCRLLDFVKKRKLDERMMTYVAGLSKTNAFPSCERELETQERYDKVVEKIRQLPENKREVMELCGIQGLTPFEAGKKLNKNPESIETIWHRTRKQLRAELTAV